MNDHHEIKAIEKRIMETVASLQALVPAYALAKQVIDYDSDRRKQLLARYAVKYEGSAAAADTAARANSGYAEELDNLAASLRSAYEVQAKWHALMARLDAARSLMSMSRETLRQMPEATGL